MENKIKITPPEGFEIDKEKSTFEEIVFKPIQKVDLSILNDTDWFYVEFRSAHHYYKQGKYYAKGRILSTSHGHLWCVNITTPNHNFYHYDTSYLTDNEYINLLRKCTDEEIAYIKQNKPDWFRKTKWEDFGEKVQGYFDANPSDKRNYDNNSEYSKCLWPTTELAAASKALCQLVRYRDDWNEGWVPDWRNRDLKYYVIFNKDTAYISCSASFSRPLTLKTQELAESFIKEFKDLLEIAKPLV